MTRATGAPPRARAVLLQPDSKHPIEGRSWKQAPSAKELAAHTGNFGCRTGRPDGAEFDLWVLDFDFKANGLHALAKLEKDHGTIPGRRVQTGGGGLHIYLEGPQPQRTCRLPVMKGLEVELKAEGAYVVAPGSRHPSGPLYYTLGRDWSWSSFPPAPDWLIDLAKQPHPAAASTRDGRGRLATTGIGSIPPAVYVPILTGGTINSKHKALCPGHGDTVPTMHVYSDHWYCSACEVGGRLRQLAAIVLHLGAQSGHTWRVDDPEERKILDKYLAKRFPGVK